ncbi:hypothetical protein C0J52_11584 [Blattella germanica]|nr:hypothetical protein C0J52_11584 [Blattella germanica]
MAKERQSEIKFQCACGVVSILFVLNCVFWETKARTVNSIKDNKVQNVALKSSLIIPSNELAWIVNSDDSRASGRHNINIRNIIVTPRRSQCRKNGKRDHGGKCRLVW